jgi:hypothetical protein
MNDEDKGNRLVSSLGLDSPKSGTISDSTKNKNTVETDLTFTTKSEAITNENTHR